MASIRKCAKCGLDLTDASAATCPMCGTTIASARRMNVWFLALLQFSVSTTFLLLFRFPRIFIPISGAFILLGTAFQALIRPKQFAAKPAPQRPVAHPVPFRILSLGVGLCAFGLICFLLFGFVIFMNSWSRWHQYEGQRHQRSDFVVTRVYYQKLSRGGRDVYASGTVDGRREWMSLMPYLHSMPHDEAELDERVPIGTSIPIYLFPDLKGRSRVQVYGDTPPAETYHLGAITAAKDGLLGAALSAGALFVLLRLRRMCFGEVEPTIALTGQEFEVGRTH